MIKHIKTRYDDTCSTCGDSLPAGSYAFWDTGEDTKTRGKTWHEGCYLFFNMPESRRNSLIRMLFNEMTAEQKAELFKDVQPKEESVDIEKFIERFKTKKFITTSDIQIFLKTNDVSKANRFKDKLLKQKRINITAKSKDSRRVFEIV